LFDSFSESLAENNTIFCCGLYIQRCTEY